jgi:hypothetical protein
MSQGQVHVFLSRFKRCVHVDFADLELLIDHFCVVKSKGLRVGQFKGALQQCC